MTPYQLKQATIPGLLMSLNNATNIPGLGQTLGTVAKHVGKFTGFKGLMQQGEKIEDFGNRAHIGLNNLLNKGPGIDYDPTKWHGAIKTPLSFLGVNVENPHQKMTAQRAAVWAGGALTAHDQLKGFFGGGQPKPEEKPQGDRRPDGMTPSVFGYDPIVSAQKQASLDIETMIRYAEETI